MDDKETPIYEEDLNLMHLCRELMHHWYVIVAVALVAALAGFLFSKAHQTYEYTASFDMIVTAKRNSADIDPTKKNPKTNHPKLPSKEKSKDNNNDKDSDKNQITEEDIALAQSLVDTYASVIQSNIVLDPVIDILGLDMTYSDLCDMVSVRTQDHSQILHVSVYGDDEVQVKKIAQQIARVPPQLLSRTARAGSCQMFSGIKIEKSVSSPSAKKITVLAAFLGAFFAIGLLFLRFLFNNSIENDEDVQSYLNLPVVGVIPAIKEVK